MQAAETPAPRRRRGFPPADPVEPRVFDRTPQEVNRHVGARIRERRNSLGIPQTGLAEAIGLSFQQIQKYEKGRNRCGPDTLYQLGEVLDVPISFFFDGLKEAAAHVDDQDAPSQRFVLELARCAGAITDEDIRSQLLGLTRALARKAQA